jgi:hypothetical protein
MASSLDVRVKLYGSTLRGMGVLDLNVSLHNITEGH